MGPVTTAQSDGIRREHRVILDLVRPGSTVLDLGCGDGTLLSLLVQKKQAGAQGLELDEQAIYKCVARGLSVFHGDIDKGLAEYGDKAFDYLIFDQSLQQVGHPESVLGEALRVGKEVIIVFPNFAHWPARVRIFFQGRTPVTRALPYEWHDSPNLHFLSILDFVTYCRDRKIRITNAVYLGRNRIVRRRPNLFAEIGIFLLAAEPGQSSQARQAGINNQKTENVTETPKEGEVNHLSLPVLGNEGKTI